MKWFYDLKISRKLIGSFSIVIALVLTLGVFSILQLNKVNAASTEMATNWVPSIRVLGQIQMSLARIRSFELQHLIATEPAKMEASRKGAEDQIAKLAKTTETYSKMLSEPEEKTIFPEILKKMEIEQGNHKKFVDLSAANKKDEARAMFSEEMTTNYREMIKQLEELVDVNNKGANKSNDLANQIYDVSQQLIIGVLAVSLAVSIALALWISRIISGPLTEAVHVAKQVAAGDLTMDIHARGKDETGELMQALKAMNDSLANIVSEVRTSTDTISTASSEIASGNLDLSSRTEEQASALEETASSMEELTSTVKQNADNARQANQLAGSAASVAVQGGTVVSEMVNTMSAIDESSRRVMDITNVIDSIAFQTNILALNASVEAARAGEQGRGFAVVAMEVRTLAQRSAAAAKEIKTLIDDSAAKIQAGNRMAQQAGTTMSEIVGSVQRVTDVVSEITAASQEQSAGIEQVNQAITQMDDVTQQNAALVEQAAAASQSLEEQAKKLSEMISVFKLQKNNVQVGSISAAVIRPAVSSGRKVIRTQPKMELVRAVGNGSWESF